MLDYSIRLLDDAICSENQMNSVEYMKKNSNKLFIIVD